MKRPSNIARLNDCARLGWLVYETLATADKLVSDMRARNIDVSAQLQIGEDAYCCALGWPHFLEQLSGAGNVTVVRGGNLGGFQLQLNLDCKPRSKEGNVDGR